MMKLAISKAASSLLRALLARTGVDRNRIILMDFRSVDWQSLTFTGERHEIELRIPGPDASRLADTLIAGLDDHEFDIPGHIVADIELAERWEGKESGSVSLRIEALTVAD